MVKIIVDDKEVEAREDFTLLDALRKIGVNVPTLCHHEAVSPYAACRLCLVEIITKKQSILAASCLYPVTAGLVIKTASERVLKARRMVTELLLARSPNVPEIQKIAEDLGVGEPRFKKKDENCILCGLCVRGCREIAGIGAIDFAGRGVYTEIVSPFKVPSDTCVGCTTCIYLCPTDAIRLGEIRVLEMPHQFEDERQGTRCGLCGEYPMNPIFHDVELISS